MSTKVRQSGQWRRVDGVSAAALAALGVYPLPRFRQVEITLTKADILAIGKPSGPILTATPYTDTSDNNGFAVNNTGNLDQNGNTSATYRVAAIIPRGAIVTGTLAGGAGYANNDTGDIQGSTNSSPGHYTVTSAPGGAPATINITAGGGDFSVGQVCYLLPGGVQPGSGDGNCTITITQISGDGTGAASALEITAAGDAYNTSDGGNLVPGGLQPGAGSSASLDSLTVAPTHPPNLYDAPGVGKVAHVVELFVSGTGTVGYSGGGSIFGYVYGPANNIHGGVLTSDALAAIISGANYFYRFTSSELAMGGSSETADFENKPLIFRRGNAPFEAYDGCDVEWKIEAVIYLQDVQTVE